MTDYSPAPGDSVKLVGKANPDNVLCGKLSQKIDHGWATITIDGEVSGREFLIGNWTITPWNRPVTFKPLAVVRLPEGWNWLIGFAPEEKYPEVALVRGRKGVWHGAKYNYVDDQEIATLLNHGAEMLFEGVDDA